MAAVLGASRLAVWTAHCLQGEQMAAFPSLCLRQLWAEQLRACQRQACGLCVMAVQACGWSRPTGHAGTQMMAGREQLGISHWPMSLKPTICYSAFRRKDEVVPRTYKLQLLSVCQHQNVQAACILHCLLMGSLQLAAIDQAAFMIP